MKFARFGPLVIAVSVLLAGCGLVGGSTQTFVDLPMPSAKTLPVTVAVQSVGETEDVLVGSPLVGVSYFNTGSGAGGTEFEMVTAQGKTANMTQFSWGQRIAEESITSAESYDTRGRLVEARLTMQLKKQSLIQLFVCGTCTIDRSRLILQYLPEDGAMRLRSAWYVEEYGSDNARGIIALGPQAMWMNASALFPKYAQWGFWETNVSPIAQVLEALDTARARLANIPADYAVFDQDGPSEVIDRQTGMVVQAKGVTIGSINFYYSNLWGRMPNTPAIGKGALSRIEWRINGKYSAVSVLSSKLTARPTSLYVFSDNEETAKNVESTNWAPLYGKLSSGQIPGVWLAVYSAGQIGKISQTSYDSEGKSSTIDIGQGGGVYYTVFGSTDVETLSRARNLLDMMGLGGIKATGFYYPTQENLGNGLQYYLGVAKLALAPNVFEQYGFDAGLLDRVGFFDPETLNP